MFSASIPEALWGRLSDVCSSFEFLSGSAEVKAGLEYFIPERKAGINIHPDQWFQGLIIW
ncbi:MAG: hypothetical protein WC554_11575 [Clostridia bacterium]|jgi:hypothetical protein